MRLNTPPCCETARARIVYAMKGALGESVGASSLWQTICGAQSLRTQLVPPNLLLPRKRTRSAESQGAIGNFGALSSRFAG